MLVSLDSFFSLKWALSKFRNPSYNVSHAFDECFNKSHLIVSFGYAVFFEQWLISSNVFNQKTTRRRWRENIIHAAQEQTQPAFCDSSQPSIKCAQNMGPVYNKQIYLDHNNKRGCVPSRASLHNCLGYLKCLCRINGAWTVAGNVLNGLIALNRSVNLSH